MKKRILAAALCLALLSGCGARPPLDLPDAESDRAVIAYVPLDDRPDNVGRVEYLAESLGYVLNMPEEWMFKTLLDGQMEDYYAENGLETQSWTGQSGYPGLLYDWVLEQEASGCDRYLLSVDQLLYGGLVASRLAETTTERDGEPWPLTDLLESLLSALAEDPNNEVWLLDSVMRLAPTVGYAGGTLEYYNAMRTIGAAPRKTLTGDELTLENIRATYDTDADGHDLLRFEDSAMYDAALRYTEHRINKLTLSGELLETVSRIGGDRFHVLIGIDDSSSEDCIQKNEIAYLQARLRAGDVILSGVDDLAFKAVTKLYLSEIGWNGAQVNVQYFGGTEDRPACDYDYKPLTEIVAEHLDYFGLTVEDTPAFADLYVLVLTQPEDAAQKQQYIQELTATLNERLKADLPVILIDAGNGQYGTAFHDALTKKAELGKLLSYAGFLDMAIVTGTALSHGVARYAFLQHGEQTDATEQAFLRTLADSILKDFCYKNIVRNDILDLDAFRAWRPEFKDAEFILEEGRYVCGWAIEKMSKSMFNVVNPDYIVDNYGADTLRMYEMFLGPLEQSKPWDTNGIDGVHKFLRRFWALFYNREGQLILTDEKATDKELKTLHKTIKKVREDIENFSFNTSVAAFMICLNELGGCSKREILEPLTVLLAPFAPHIAEELWHTLGHTTSVCDAQYPVCEEKYLVESSFEYPVSVNGKLRFKKEYALTLSPADIQADIVRTDEAQKWLEGKAPKKIIVVPGKIINIVI